jgi:hypothetical protein
MVKWMDDNAFRGAYDFFYLPRGSRTNKSLGYAFVNFRNPSSVRQFHEVASANNLPVSHCSAQGLHAVMMKWLRSASLSMAELNTAALPFVDVNPGSYAATFDGSEVPMRFLRLQKDLASQGATSGPRGCADGAKAASPPRREVVAWSSQSDYDRTPSNIVDGHSRSGLSDENFQAAHVAREQARAGAFVANFDINKAIILQTFSL